MESCDTRSISTVMLSPPCASMACASADALAEARVVNTTKKPSLANFWAMAPPMPQRMPTGRSLSSMAPPCASFVLRPSACPLGGCADDDGDLFTGWAHDEYLPFGCDGVATVPDGGCPDRKDSMP